MKIAVIGVYYASNLGDAIICDCVAFWLKKKWPTYPAYGDEDA